MEDFLLTYLLLIGTFSIIIGGIITLFFLFISFQFFISEEIKKILKSLALSIFFLSLYFFSYILELFFPLSSKNLIITFFQTILIVLNLFFLIYSSLLIYRLSIEIGFSSPKNKRKIKNFLEIKK